MIATASKPAVATPATTVAILAGLLKCWGIHLILGKLVQSLNSPLACRGGASPGPASVNVPPTTEGMTSPARKQICAITLCR